MTRPAVESHVDGIKGVWRAMLAEREHHLDVLRRLYLDCEAGRGGLVVINGPAGTGKTELLRELGVKASRSGARFLVAVGARAERLLPFGVMRQILRTARLANTQDRRVRRLVEDAAVSVLLSESEPDADDTTIESTLQRIGRVIIDSAEECPVVIGVDDLQHVDVPSLRGLCWLARRANSIRLMLVVAQDPAWQTSILLPHAVMVEQSFSHRLQLRPLSPAGVRDVLALHSDPSTAAALAAPVHALTAGNPLLLRGFLHDQGAMLPTEPAALVVEDGFDHAVLACLYRSEPTVIAMARMLAVLAEPPDSLLLEELLDAEPEALDRAWRALETAGLARDGWFTNVRIRDAVLRTMPGSDQADLHRRAAQIFQRNGSPVTVFARHLAAADSMEEPWVVPALREAAEAAIRSGDLEFAARCLRRAQEACRDSRQKLALRFLATRLTWRVDPSAAIPRLDEFVAAVRADQLALCDALDLVNYLLWYGHADDAIELLSRVASTSDADAEAVHRIVVARDWLSFSYPARGKDFTYNAEGLAGSHVGASTANVEREATRALAEMFNSILCSRLRSAEQVLHLTVLEAGIIAPAMVALAALVFADRLERAESWCGQLLDEEGVQRTPLWHAMITAMRAELALRQGNLMQADELARAALTLVPPRGWGVGIAAPLSTSLRAETMMGRFDEAVGRLRTSVPAAVFETPQGLLYLQARGHFYLATGRIKAAFSDFDRCRKEATAWGLDWPVLIPWRRDLAHAYLRLGSGKRAGELLRQQLELLGPDDHRSRGMCLRLLAATSPAEQVDLLDAAIDELRKAQDKVELAQAYADLGETFTARGDHKRARPLVRTAYHLAQECRANVVLTRLHSSQGGDSAPPWIEQDMAAVTLLDQLSGSERRVAALAAAGHTNREIAERLYLTVSTVEQHLTRVYRKLKVDGRMELPAILQLKPAGNGSTRQSTDTAADFGSGPLRRTPP